ncbi:MAG: MarR family transcriptional regulator [Promethearchaeota archaeon]
MNVPEKRFLKVVTTYYKTITTYLRNYRYDDIDIGFDVFIIDFLGNNPSSTMTEIANFLKVKSLGTATKRIDRLVDFGYVSRTNPEKDRRQVQINLTESGKGLYQYFLQNRLSTMKIIMKNFKEEELNTFLSIIERLLKLYKEVPLDFFASG